MVKWEFECQVFPVHMQHSMTPAHIELHGTSIGTRSIPDAEDKQEKAAVFLLSSIHSRSIWLATVGKQRAELMGLCLIKQETFYCKQMSLAMTRKDHSSVLIYDSHFYHVIGFTFT